MDAANWQISLVCVAGTIIIILLLIVTCFQLGIVDRLKKSCRRRGRRSKRNIPAVKMTKEDQGGLTINILPTPGPTEMQPLNPTYSLSLEPPLKSSDESADTDLLIDEPVSSPIRTESDISEECQEDECASETGGNLNTSIYLFMGKPTRSVYNRSSSTPTCISPSSPYLVDIQRGSDNNEWFKRHKSVPVARCFPLRTSPDIEIIGNEVQTPTQEGITTPWNSRQNRRSVCESLRSPPLSLPPRSSINISDHEESFESDPDDLFKGGWWKSSESLNKDDTTTDDVFKDDDLKSVVSLKEDFFKHDDLYKMTLWRSKQSLSEDGLKANGISNGDWRTSKQSLKADGLKANGISNGDWRTSKQSLKADGTCNRDWLSSRQSLKEEGFKTDNIFNGKWWQSKESLRKFDFENDDREIRDLIRRKSFSGPSACSGSVYVHMDTSTLPRPCRPPSADGRRRSKSLTLPDVFQDRTAYQGDVTSPTLSVWYPPALSGNLQSPPLPCSPPKPCTSPHYVNFRGTLPNRF
ncbi:uncharacterized protein LOC124128767 isoform X2 [Haliotis rufescens]|uniref:uncharacterized protein LOC124128767 isoform X2 n=1 Tax=Haliotis rufescens TaxID=6454 RepID=UPI00201F7CE2|nr:uncharacterized protein LOC124128767 isoform X2 [Haliotis rufescens]